MNTLRSNAGLLALALTAPGFGQSAVLHRLGDHPAVIVKRMEATAGYDYASKFYPHPAWLYLLSEAPLSAPNPPVATTGPEPPTNCSAAKPACLPLAKQAVSK